MCSPPGAVVAKLNTRQGIIGAEHSLLLFTQNINNEITYAFSVVFCTNAVLMYFYTVKLKKGCL
jgi:hypothetical protein